MIQKQSEAIVTKDQQIKELKKENEGLKKKVNSLQEHKFSKRIAAIKSETIVVTPPAPILPPPSFTNLKHEIKKEKIEEEEKEEITNESEIVCMETSEPYFTIQHGVEVIEENDVEMQKKAEVPGWRLKPISASYIMEGTENIEDENLSKRHQKPENDEKRRKRWDVQRIREQRHVARLRARYDPNDENHSTLINNPNLTMKLMPEASKESLDIKTLLPDPEDATDILVQENLPVSVFGCVLPKLISKDFSLPWLN